MIHVSFPFFLTAGGLFDFDLTFLAEILLFGILSLAVTSLFLSPISTILSDRAKDVNRKLLKASVLVTVGYTRFSQTLQFLTSELKELNRQIELTKTYGTMVFEEEFTCVESEKDELLQELKQTLSNDSASLFWKISDTVTLLTDTFFAKKFKSR